MGQYFLETQYWNIHTRIHWPTNPCFKKKKSYCPKFVFQRGFAIFMYNQMYWNCTYAFFLNSLTLFHPPPPECRSPLVRTLCPRSSSPFYIVTYTQYNFKRRHFFTSLRCSLFLSIPDRQSPSMIPMKRFFTKIFFLSLSMILLGDVSSDAS